jgi:hypothetical protein
MTPEALARASLLISFFDTIENPVFYYSVAVIMKLIVCLQFIHMSMIVRHIQILCCTVRYSQTQLLLLVLLLLLLLCCCCCAVVAAAPAAAAAAAVAAAAAPASAAAATTGSIFRRKC